MWKECNCSYSLALLRLLMAVIGQPHTPSLYTRWRGTITQWIVLVDPIAGMTNTSCPCWNGLWIKRSTETKDMVQKSEYLRQANSNPYTDLWTQNKTSWKMMKQFAATRNVNTLIAYGVSLQHVPFFKIPGSNRVVLQWNLWTIYVVSGWLLIF